VIGLNDSGGARIQEGVVSLAGTPTSSAEHAARRRPQISVIMGRARGRRLLAAITDFTFMVATPPTCSSPVPKSIRTVTHEEVTKEKLGGAMTHNAPRRATFAAADDRDGADAGARQLGLHAVQQHGRPAREATDDPVDRADVVLNSIVPPSSSLAYDIKKVIGSVVDDGQFLEVHEHFAKNIVVGVCAAGRTLGRPRGESAGGARRVLDINASVKAARFVRSATASTSR
jgi:propionyl-CoA carboxylase beta chain